MLVLSSTGHRPSGGIRDIAPLRQTAIDMGHQGATTVTCDNTTVVALANDYTCKQKRSRAIDMRYHWVRDRVKLVWRSNRFSLADYLTKCHPARHCLYMCQFYYKPIPMLLRLLRLLRLRHPLPPRRAVTDILSPWSPRTPAEKETN